MRRIHWGILGAGTIARRFAAALARHEDSILWAAACRTREKALAFSAEHPAQRVYDSYDALLADPEVDAVYLALPHDLHLEWGLRAIRAGKALLCEKPLTMDAAQTEQLITAAREEGVLLMEAMKQRFLPAGVKLRRLVREGTIGELLGVEASFCDIRSFDGSTYHTRPGVGGALLDTGIYCASYLEEYLPGPFRLESLEFRMKNGVDFYVSGQFIINGRPGRLECGFDCAYPWQAVLHGTQGELTIEELQKPLQITLRRKDQPPEVISVPYEVDDFYSEIAHFAQCLRAGLTESPIMPLSASLRCARILDCIRERMPEK